VRVAVWIGTDWIETRVMGRKVEVDPEDGNIGETTDLPMIHQDIIHHLAPLALGNRIITIIMTIYLNGILSDFYLRNMFIFYFSF